MTHEAQNRTQDQIPESEGENTQDLFSQMNFAKSFNLSSEELKIAGFSDDDLKKMAKHIEPPHGNEINAREKIDWLVWHYDRINRNGVKHRYFVDLQDIHIHGRRTIFNNKKQERGDLVVGNSNSNNVSTSKLENSDSEEKLSPESAKFYKIIGELAKGEKLESSGFGKLDENGVDSIIAHIDKLRTTNEEHYYRFVLLIAETNHIYRDPKKNKTIENQNFEKLTQHLDSKIQKEVTEMSLNLDHNTISENFDSYINEKNQDKKRMILDFILEHHTSAQEKEFIKQNIKKSEKEDLNTYKNSLEYKILKELPILEQHTAADILKQSPKQTAEALKASQTYLGKNSFGIAKLAGIVLIFGASIKKFGFFKGILAGAAGTLLTHAAYVSVKQMNPGEGFEWDDMIDGIFNAREDSSNNINTENFRRVNTFLFAQNSVSQVKIGEEDINDISKQIFASDNFKKIHISKIEDYVGNAGMNLKDIFGDEIPTDSNGNQYSDKVLKEYLNRLLGRKESTDLKGKSLLFSSTTITSTPGAAGTESAIASVTTTPGAAGTESATASVTTTPGAAGTESATASVTTTPGAAGIESPTASVTTTPGANGKESVAQKAKDKIEGIQEGNYEVIGYTEKGANYIIGPDGTKELFSYEQLTPKFKETLENHENLVIKIENLQLLFSAFLKNQTENTELQELKREFDILLNNFDIINLDTSISTINDNIPNITKELGIEEVDLANHSEVLKYIFESLDNWEMVQREIILERFDDTTKVSNEDVQKLRNNETIPKSIKTILGNEESKEIQKEIIDMESMAKKKWNTHREEYIKKYPEVGEKILQQSILDSFVGQYAETAIMTAYLKKNPGDIDDSTLEIYEDIEGLGGFFDWKSSTKEWWKEEGWKMIATEAAILAVGVATGGVGAFALKAGLHAARGSKYLSQANKMGNLAQGTFRGSSVVKFAGTSIVEGASFHAGYVGARNGFEEENMSYSDGLMHSILGVAAFKGVSQVFNSAMAKGLIQNNVMRVGSEVAAGTGALSALGFYHDGVLFSPGEWTTETVYQALFMYGGLKAMGKITEGAVARFKTRKGGGVEVQQVTNPGTVQKATEALTPGNKVTYQNSKGENFIIEKRQPNSPEDITVWKTIQNESGTTSVKKVTPQQRSAILTAYNKQQVKLDEVGGTNVKPNETTVSPKETVQTNLGKTLEKGYKKEIGKLKKSGDTYTSGEYKVTYIGKEYHISKNGSDIMTVKKPAEAVTFLKENANHKKLVEDVLNKKDKALDKSVHNKEVEMDGSIYRISKNTSGDRVIQKKGEGGGFSKVEIDTLSPSQLEKIAETMLGKGAIGKIDKAIASESGKKFGDVITMDKWLSIKQYITGKGVPEGKVNSIMNYLWNKTLGDTLNNASLALNNPGARKLFLVRNLMTGKNSPNLWSQSEKGGILPTAWLPSGKNTGLLFGLTVTKTGVGLMNGEGWTTTGGQEALIDFAQASLFGWIGLVGIEHELLIQLAKHGIEAGKEKLSQ